MNVKMTLTMKTQPRLRSKEMTGLFTFCYAHKCAISTLKLLVI